MIFNLKLCQTHCKYLRILKENNFLEDSQFCENYFSFCGNVLLVITYLWSLGYRNGTFDLSSKAAGALREFQVHDNTGCGGQESCLSCFQPVTSQCQYSLSDASRKQSLFVYSNQHPEKGEVFKRDVHWSCISVTLRDSYLGRVKLSFLSRSLRRNEVTLELKKVNTVR